jgi:LysM repeat protein
MGIAQTHAEYMAAIGVSNVHTDAQGLLPFQRAIAAGYMVAGDLALHGFFSENVTGGVGITPQDAVHEWMGDEPHLNTMVASTLFDVGAGVAFVGNTFYYCLDAGQSNGGTPVAYTPPAPLYTSVPTLIPNTPNADGSIIHIIQPGDTVGTIAEAYDVPIADILRLNNITLQSKIYAGNKLIIRAANTPTPTQPTGTPTGLPTITTWPTSTPTFTQTPPLPTPTASPGLPASAARNSVLAIIVAALVIAGLIALIGHKRN